MKQAIEEAKDGETVKANAMREDYVPTSVLKLLDGKDVSLEVRCPAGTVTVNGMNLLPIPDYKIWYEFEDFVSLYKDVDPTARPAQPADVPQETPAPEKENPSTGR